MVVFFSSMHSAPHINILLSPLIRFSKTPRAIISVPSPKIRNCDVSILRPVRSSASSDRCSFSACESKIDTSSTSSSSISAPSRIFVKGLSRSTTEGCLVNVFSCFGDISKVKFITSKGSKESLGLAYIWFAREEDALLAVKEMNGKFVDGRFIAVMMARPEAPSKQVRIQPYRFR